MGVMGERDGVFVEESFLYVLGMLRFWCHVTVVSCT
jgi:hypothetical protein